MMHVCPMQAMRSRVGLHATSRYSLGTIGGRLDPLIYTQGEAVILSSWASSRSTHKQNTILSSWLSPRSIHNTILSLWVIFEINTQQTTILISWVFLRSIHNEQRSSVRGLSPRSKIINCSWVIPVINDYQFMGFTTLLSLSLYSALIIFFS
ncbi:hypothetical protein AHAS_Ahas03G0245600 [Arachis hypogaea]